MTDTVFLTGGGGLLALNWAMAARERHRVVLGIHEREVNLAGVEAGRVHLQTVDGIVRSLDAQEPRFVVHTAGLTSVDACEADPRLAQHVNVNLAVNVARACRGVGVPLVHISTDHLFAGDEALVDETHPTAPRNVYGRTKAAAEVGVLEANPDVLVVRSNFYGWGTSYRRSFSDRIVVSLRAGQPLTLFRDVFYTPILIESLVHAVHELLRRKTSGVFHIGGDDRISKWDFGLMVADEFQLDAGLINPGLLSDLATLVQRPRDMSLSNANVRARLGRALGGPRDHLARLHEQERAGFARELQSPSRRSPARSHGSCIPYARHHVDEDDVQAVAHVLRNEFLTQGPAVEAFERAVAEYAGVTYAVAVSSGTAALHLAALASGVGPGTSLITSPITFVASANAALYVGANPLFADVDAETVNMAPSRLAEVVARHPETRAVVPVHFAGFPCDMPRIKTVADAAGAVVIEDAAHALGATYADGRRVGSCVHSLMTVFSFHPVKAIAAGEGGMVTTNDEQTFRRLVRLRSHGINKFDDPFELPDQAVTSGAPNPWYYEMQEVGFNYRITDIQCALARSQFRKIDAFIARRRELVETYDAAFARLSNCRPAQVAHRGASGHHLYVLRIDFAAVGRSRAQLMGDLRARGVGTQVHYLPVPAHPYYHRLGCEAAEYPNAQAYYAEALSIPLFYDLGDDQQQVISAITELVG